MRNEIEVKRRAKALDVWREHGMKAAMDAFDVSRPTLFTGIVIAVSLAIGLAFGLGGQASAARYLERLQSEIKD